MGIDSEYYKEKNKKKLIKLRQLESVMPPYVVSYLNDKELSSQINTVIAYAYDLQTFFRFLTEKNNLLKNTAIKPPVTASLFCGHPHIYRLRHAPEAARESFRRNARSSLLLVVLPEGRHWRL